MPSPLEAFFGLFWSGTKVTVGLDLHDLWSLALFRFEGLNNFNRLFQLAQAEICICPSFPDNWRVALVVVIQRYLLLTLEDMGQPHVHSDEIFLWTFGFDIS